MFSAKIIADSVTKHGHRAISYVNTFPRYILAEYNTHRMFGRNSASSRAIPFKKLVQSVRDNPFIPMAWQKDHPGMQGTEYFNPEAAMTFELAWKADSLAACEKATAYNEHGVTKQLANRLLEPFMWHTAITTATEYENFFALRCPQYSTNGGKDIYRSKKDYINAVPMEVKEVFELMTNLDWLLNNKGMGEIHIMEIAEQMWDTMNENKPTLLQPGEWHIPFGDQIDEQAKDSNTVMYGPLVRVKIATTRCAQISYVVADSEGKAMDFPKMISRHDKLAADGHWSPFEHPLRAMTDFEYRHWTKTVIVQEEDWDYYKQYNRSDTYDFIYSSNGVIVQEFGWCGHIRGFIPYRKMFANENKQVL